MTALWIALLLATIGCFGLKLAGVSLPASVLNHPRVQRVAGLLPPAMLAALVGVQLFDRNGRYGLDWPMLGGVAAAVLALLLRRGFLTVFLVAILCTAALRAIG